MGLNCGIVGLPNVGKSTLFNALTHTALAQAMNYPFCTIEPNVGRIAVPDARLDRISDLAYSLKKLPTFLEIVDIAGLVRGASQGEGLGNQFLGHIREIDAVLHVLRCFEDADIAHVEGGIDPLRDMDIVDTELLLADLESLERREASLIKKARGKNAEAERMLDVIHTLKLLLEDGNPARVFKSASFEESLALKNMQLLTYKPTLYICNVAETEATTGNAWTRAVQARAQDRGENAKIILVSAAIEAEIALLQDADEQQAYIQAIGLQETGLDRIVKEGYELLNLITFFTAGPKESHAWTIRQGAKAPEAAGTIHTDFERGFICAETISCADFIFYKGENGARNAGKVRLEGRDYSVQDGDIFHFRFNV
ncbi:MAG: redox-regulated ATPase YchF [Holosporales bacterium]|jgi:GTP-binding protein YchF|nr:redox-regulated ATPase YchF [Holosporales bacterium]